MAYHSWTSRPPTKEYQDAHPAEFTKWKEKYCQECGLLPEWCECGVLFDIIKREREFGNEARERMANLYGLTTIRKEGP